MEPRRQSRARVMEDRASGRVNVMPAIAGVGPELLEAMERAYLPTFRASRLFAVANLKKMLKARIVIREPSQKLL